MLYLRICFDKQGCEEMREQLRQAHREYLTSFIGEQREGAQIVHGGPMCLTDDVSRHDGSFLIVEAESLEHARRFHDNDPFVGAGLFDRADVVRWEHHIGNEGQAAVL